MIHGFIRPKWAKFICLGPALSLFCSFTLIPITAQAQGIGQQGTDPYTGQPANPAAAASLPDPADHPSHSADQEHRLVLRSRTILVEVPTVVTDLSGSYIHNLTKNDFKILENGKQQGIAVFKEVTSSGGRPPQVTNPPGSFSNGVLDGEQPFSLTIIALDTINTPFLDQAYGRKQLIKYLAEDLDAGHVFGLVVIGSKGVEVLSGLNSDSSAVIAALKKASGELSSTEIYGIDGRVSAVVDGPPSELTGGISRGEDLTAKMRQFIVSADALEGSYHQARAVEDTMKAFLAIALSLSGIPGRKSLIWATGGFPFALDSPSDLPGDDLGRLYERTLQALNDSQISVYPVDIRGLVGTSPTVDATYSGGLSGPEFANSVAGRSWLQDSSVKSLENFAAMTGGHSYANNNDLTAGFKRAADDSSSYYLLGYYVGNDDRSPGWRKLQIQIARKNVEVRARSGFFVTSTTMDPQLTHQADIAFALNSPFDSTGIQVTVEWKSVTPAGDKKKIGFALHVPATSVIDEADQNRFDVDFVAQASKRGTPAGQKGQTVKGTIPPASLVKIKAEGISYKNVLELPSGEYQVRFVVRDNLTGRIGSVSAPLSVN